MSRTYIPRGLRERVTQQAHRRCGYCLTQERVTGTPMDVEHIIPEALGGVTIESNLWLACFRCNARKGERISGVDSESGALVQLFDPRRQRWTDHFAWTEDGTRIVGLTPVGRATVTTLSLNRSPLVGARLLWVAAGWHPPSA